MTESISAKCPGFAQGGHGARNGVRRMLDCGQSPVGRIRKSLHLFAGQMVAVGHVEECSHMAVEPTLRKGFSLT